MNSRRMFILIVLFLFPFYLSLASLHIGSGDGETMHQVSRSLVESLYILTHSAEPGDLG
jgi:hypothetical protein